MGFPLKNILKAGFPFIATALSTGGPLGAMAAAAIGKGLGVDIKKPEDAEQAVIDATSVNPETLTKLKEIENDFQLKMAQLGYDQIDKLEALAANDRASARAREIAVKDATPRNIAYIVVAATIFLEGFMLFHSMPTGLDPVILGRILGTLDMAVGLVLSYYFGSSAGSSAKDATIHELSK